MAKGDVAGMNETVRNLVQQLQSLDVMELPEPDLLTALGEATKAAKERMCEYHLKCAASLGGAIVTVRRGRPAKNGDEPVRHRDGKTLMDWTRDAMKAMKQTGGTKQEIADAVLANGYETDSPRDKFVDSVYQGGINKLIKAGEAEYFKPKGAVTGKYRLVK